MKIKDDNGVIVPNIQRTHGGGISVARSAEYERYLKSIEMAQKVKTMESEISELRTLVNGLVKAINNQ